MKSWCRTLFSGVLLTTSLSGALEQDQTVGLGHTEGNGGDGYVLEFKAMAQQWLSFLRQNSLAENLGIDLEQFEKTLAKMNFSSVDHILYIRNVPKDVKNYYPNNDDLVISRPRWRSLLESQKFLIVLHEVLVVMGLPDLRYEISSRALAKAPFGRNSITFGSIQRDQAGFLEWAQSTRYSIQRALASLGVTTILQRERALLVMTIQEIMEKESPFLSLLNPTLMAALSDMAVYEQDPVRQVFLLKTYFQFALDDLETLSQRQRINVVQLLNRGASMAMTSRSYAEEFDLFLRLEQRALLFLDSLGPLDGYHECVRGILEDLLTHSLEENVALRDHVYMSREKIGALVSKRICTP